MDHRQLGKLNFMDSYFSFLTIEQTSAIVSIVVAFATFLGWIMERMRRVSDRKERMRQVWNNISKVRGLMSDLEKEGDVTRFDHGKHQAVGKLTFMFRDLVNEAISLEDRPSLEIIKKWRQAGKIASDWQESCFVNCLLTSELSDLKLANTTLQQMDELPATHLMSATPKK